MAQLKLVDGNKAAIYSLPQEDTDTDALVNALVAGGWSAHDALLHVLAAIRAGAYQYVESPQDAASHAEEE